MGHGALVLSKLFLKLLKGILLQLLFVVEAFLGTEVYRTARQHTLAEQTTVAAGLSTAPHGWIHQPPQEQPYQVVSPPLFHPACLIAWSSFPNVCATTYCLQGWPHNGTLQAGSRTRGRWRHTLCTRVGTRQAAVL